MCCLNLSIGPISRRHRYITLTGNSSCRVPWWFTLSLSEGANHLHWAMTANGTVPATLALSLMCAQLANPRRKRSPSCMCTHTANRRRKRQACPHFHICNVMNCSKLFCTSIVTVSHPLNGMVYIYTTTWSLLCDNSRVCMLICSLCDFDDTQASQQ
jgi:hypothetical protein